MRFSVGRRAGIGALAFMTVALVVAFVGLSGAWAAKGGGGKPGGEAAGNNLSYPVIWSEGVSKALRGEPGALGLAGAVYYWWGIDEDDNPEACLADEDDTDYCDDGAVGSVGPMPCEDGLDPECILVYPQQDSLNEWQAASHSMKNEVGVYTGPVNVHWIDWGDNLESVDWYTKSQVRVEVVLIQDLALMDPPTPSSLREYGMRHLEGWGITELWGLATTGKDPGAEPVAEEFAGAQATVYSDCARLVIQKLTKAREDPTLALAWDAALNAWVGDANPSLFTDEMVVWLGGDGPGYYSAEINVKGKVIYGYTWNVRKLNEGPGDYRFTFNLDDECPAGLNTYFDAGTQIVPAAEEEITEEEEADEGGDTGGAVAVIDTLNNLTYMDVRILERGGKIKK